MRYKLLVLLSFIGMALAGFADDVVFKASAPSQVIVGRPFQLTFSVNHSARDLRAPQFTDFDVLSGPYTVLSRSDRRPSEWTVMIFSPTVYAFRCCRKISSPQRAVRVRRAHRVRRAVRAVRQTATTCLCALSSRRPACRSKRHCW